jgi:hypothetical protein
MAMLFNIFVSQGTALTVALSVGGAYHLRSLDNVMMLTRLRRVSPDQNTSRNTIRDLQGRNLTTAALTVERVLLNRGNWTFTSRFTLGGKCTAALSVGRVLLHLKPYNLREFIQGRGLTPALIVGRASVNQGP